MNDPLTVVERLRRSVEERDLPALADCFAADYRNETPAHPARGFVGRDQVRANWERILAGMSDVTAVISRTAVDRDVVWSEWELAGRRADGSRQALRGVIIFGVAGDELAWARFYLEPVDEGDGSVDRAVGHLVDGTSR